MKNVDFENLPKHIAIIMDGNGRWAKKRLSPRSFGHRAGAKALRSLVEEMETKPFENLTVFALSTENWSRPKEEIDFLLNLLGGFIQEYIDDTTDHDLRISVIGELSKLDDNLRRKIEELEDKTKTKTGMRLNFAINYGGRDDIVRATKSFAQDLLKAKIKPEDLDEKVFGEYLDTFGMPDVDLLIRTSGEMRVSNFLLWQMAFAEFYVTDKLWPDFGYKDLLEAVQAFQNRNRRFGGLL